LNRLKGLRENYRIRMGSRKEWSSEFDSVVECRDAAEFNEFVQKLIVSLISASSSVFKDILNV